MRTRKNEATAAKRRVKLYITDPAASGQPPLALEGFQRVNLAAGASATVTFPVSQQSLQYWNTSTNAVMPQRPVITRL